MISASAARLTPFRRARREHSRRGDCIEHRERVFLADRRQTKRDVFHHFHQDAAETERNHFAKARIGDSADQDFLSAA